MDFVKDIDKPVLYWVSKIRGHHGRPELWGGPIAATSGFGPSNERGFHGDVACISASAHWRGQNITLSQAHTTRGGFFCFLNGEKQEDLPTPPFLVTDYMDLRLVRQEEVSFEPAHEWEELDESDGRIEEYPLCCPEWLGILRVDKAESNRKGLLLIFSDRSEVVVVPNQTLVFADNPQEVFGTVTPSELKG